MKTDKFYDLSTSLEIQHETTGFDLPHVMLKTIMTKNQLKVHHEAF